MAVSRRRTVERSRLAGSLSACRPACLAYERRACLPGPRRGVAQKRRERSEHHFLELGVPATDFPDAAFTEEVDVMAAVMIGVDPHKGSHTAVAITGAEQTVGELRVCASQAQAE